jgi:hypothetical protein
MINDRTHSEANKLIPAVGLRRMFEGCRPRAVGGPPSEVSCSTASRAITKTLGIAAYYLLLYLDVETVPTIEVGPLWARSRRSS